MIWYLQFNNDKKFETISNSKSISNQYKSNVSSQNGARGAG